MSIKTWPENERPREKLLHKGAGALSDAELLAILLRVGTHGFSAVELGRELIKNYGSLGSLFHAPFAKFKQQKGMGLANYTQFAAVKEISLRLLGEKLQHKVALNDPDAVKEYLRLHLGFQKIEVFMALFLDNQNQILCVEEISQGTLTQSVVYVREVIKKALEHNASALIVAHNHPSGSLNASDADKDLTMQLQQALNLVDIRLLDHFIVTQGDTVSFLEQGWMS